jgi:hypothetical protein
MSRRYAFWLSVLTIRTSHAISASYIIHKKVNFLSSCSLFCSLGAKLRLSRVPDIDCRLTVTTAKGGRGIERNRKEVILITYGGANV